MGERNIRPVPPVAKEHSPISPDFYQQNTERVKNQLRGFGFGPTTEFLTPDKYGIDRQKYLDFARERLLHDGKIGEVEMPNVLSNHAKDISALLISFNVGYGHLRPALAMQNLIEVMGGEAKSAFLGGEEDVIPRTKGVDFGRINDWNRFLRAISRLYRETNLKTAYEQGMMHEAPDLTDPDPEYTKRAMWFLKQFGASGEKFKEDPAAAIAEVMAFTKERGNFERIKSDAGLSILARRSFRKLIHDTFDDNGDKEKLIISTHCIMSEIIGTISPFTQKRIGYEAANFQPDVNMFYDTYTKNPPTYTERKETVEKWGIRQGFKHGEPAKNSVVMNGYITPLSVFERNHLNQQRREALENGEPLTVIATASGNAPAQLGSFKEFILDNMQQFADNKLRMVIECGAEEGGGMPVYKELADVVEQHHLEDNVILHASPTPEASLQFFEALSWAPIPIAMMVKASEMTRIAQAFNVPLISTGALGQHELWNLGATLLDNPTSVVFSEKTGVTVAKGIEDVIPNDILVKHHPEKEYVAKLTSAVAQQTATTPEELLDKVREYIVSGQKTTSRQDAMLVMLSDMLKRKYPKE